MPSKSTRSYESCYRAFVCENCGTTFRLLVSQTKRSPPRFCSRACSGVAHRQSVTNVCVRCKKPFDVPPSHQWIQFCSKDCHYTYTKEQTELRHTLSNTRNCAQCGKVLTVVQKKFCSNKCHAATLKTREERECLECGQSFETTSGKLAKGTGKYCSFPCFHKTLSRSLSVPRVERIERICKSCQKPFFILPSVSERAQFCSRRCTGVWRYRHVPTSGTNLEKIVADLLQQEALQVIPQHKIGRHKVDFYLPDTQLVIECDGTFWHQNEEAKAKDARQTALLRSHGYDVLRLSERDILDRLDWCREQIIQHVSLGPSMAALQPTLF